jgi:hypothetical protein
VQHRLRNPFVKGKQSSIQTNKQKQQKISPSQLMKTLLRQTILIMRHHKSAAIALCMIACFTMGSVPSASASPPTPVPVTITAAYDFSTFPNVTGTFITSGALTISGVSTMAVGLNANGIRAHCVVTLIPSDGSGTIIIDQECQFATSMPAPYPTGQGKGRWEIVGGTGAYANLNGNGSLTMPTSAQGFPEEAMTGYLYH